MLNRKERTIEKYINAGAQMRLFTTIARDMACKLSEVVSAADADRVMKALHNAVDEMVVERAREALDELFRKAD